jgi:peptidoglycan/LPS O-acetylase OafA/YrhL
MKLRRITTHGNWIPEIDGLRFVAIMSVLLGHIAGQTLNRSPRPFAEDIGSLVNIFISHAGRGVQLFFAISGFILAQPFLRQHRLGGRRVSVRGFYKRRLTRLEPPYILSLLIYAGALLVHHVSLRWILPPLLTQMAYIHGMTNLESINFVTWSLEVEVQFYILAPLLGCLYAIQSAVVRRGVMVLFIGISMALHTFPSTKVSMNLPGQLQFFMVGFLLADLRAGRNESTIKGWWDAVSVGALTLIFWLPERFSVGLLPGLILLVCLSAFNGPVTRQVLREPWIALTGGMCYSFYLMHMLVISTVFKLTRRLVNPSSFTLSYLVQAVALEPCIYLCCTAFYVFIERPCMDPLWPSKVFAKLSKQQPLRDFSTQ